MQNSQRGVTAPHYYQLYSSLDLAYRDSATAIHPSQYENGINGPARHGLAAFMLTGAIWESLLNFAFFSVWTRPLFGERAAERCSSLSEELDKLNLVEKTYVLPMFAFERSFNKGTILFQELKTMVAVRNRIVHDLPNRIPEKEIAFLRHHKCLLSLPAVRFPADERPWQMEIATMESIRWCMNLLPKLVEELIRLSGHPAKNLRVFPNISVQEARRMISLAEYIPGIRTTQYPLR